jgi:hypothetical protein
MQAPYRERPLSGGHGRGSNVIAGNGIGSVNQSINTCQILTRFDVFIVSSP